jgi:hypothetical protein
VGKVSHLIQYLFVMGATALTSIIIPHTWSTASHLVGNKYFTPSPLHLYSSQLQHMADTWGRAFETLKPGTWA